MTDPVDTILEQWRRERPDLDTSTMGVIGRLGRLAEIFGRAHAETFRGFGLDRGEFDVLATLRRAGAPFHLSPTRLFRSLMISSGGMTARLDRLERAGWVRRAPDPDDRRGVRVELTEDGLALVDRAVAAHVEKQHALLAALSADERQVLAGLLRRLLVAHADGAGEPAG